METPQKVMVRTHTGSPFQKEEPHSESDSDFRKFVEGLPAAIYTCDLEGRITYYNEAAAELWGRRPAIGKDMWCGSWKIYRTDGTLLPLDECPMAITLKEGRAIMGEEIVIERPDGIRIHVIPHPKPIFDSKGKMTGAINMLVDITEKKEREQVLHASETRYRLLSESLERKVDERTATLRESEARYHKMIEEVQDYAILLLDKDGTILNWNKGAEKIKGYSENEIIGKNFRIFYREVDRAAKLPEQLIQVATEKGKAMHEGWRLRKDGTWFWGSIVITALHDEDQNVIGFSKVTRDLTERKLAEDQMKKDAKDLEFKNNELEQYAYVASHDLQEPLRKMLVFIELLEKGIDDKASVKKNLEKISSSAKRMTTLIKDTLRYAQLSTSEELFADVDLNEVLENVKEDFDLLIEQKHAVITHSELPVIKGIPIQLHQLFSNLISNSLKFSSKNPVIEINAEEPLNGELKKYPHLNSSHNYLKILFKDNGIGFEPQYASHIFELFKRFNETREGTGIGLALCKKIVENHNGSISVSSEQNKGTIFTIFLPVA